MTCPVCDSTAKLLARFVELQQSGVDAKLRAVWHQKDGVRRYYLTIRLPDGTIET